MGKKVSPRSPAVTPAGKNEKCSKLYVLGKVCMGTRLQLNLKIINEAYKGHLGILIHVHRFMEVEENQIRAACPSF